LAVRCRGAALPDLSAASPGDRAPRSTISRAGLLPSSGNLPGSSSRCAGGSSSPAWRRVSWHACRDAVRPAAAGFVRWFHPTSKPAAYPRPASAEALACARGSRARAACLPRRDFVRIPAALGFVRWFHPTADRPLTSTRIGQGSRPRHGPKAGAAQEQARSRQRSQVHSRAGRKSCQRRCGRPEHSHSGRPGRGLARPPA
jgi:hypothetical protein